MAASLQLLLGKGRERASRAPAWILSADLATAFDEIRLGKLFRALARWGAPLCLAFATLREVYGVDAEPFLAGARADSVSFFRLRQGGPESTTLFSAVIRRAPDSAVPARRSMGRRGIDLPFVRADRVVFAGNVFLAGRSESEVLGMFGCAAAASYEFRLSWKPASSAIVGPPGTTVDPLAYVCKQGSLRATPHTFVRVRSMTVLGT